MKVLTLYDYLYLCNSSLGISHCLIILTLTFKVSRCLHEILEQCSQFSKLLVNCSSPLSQGELSHLQFIAKVRK